MEPWGRRNDDALRVEGEHPIKYEREQRKKEYHECDSMINSFLTARGGNPVQSIIHCLGLNQKIRPGLFFRSRSLHADFRTPGSKFQNLLSRVGIPRGRLSGILVSSKLTQWFETTQTWVQSRMTVSPIGNTTLSYADSVARLNSLVKDYKAVNLN